MANYGSKDVAFITVNGYLLADVTELNEGGNEELTRAKTSFGDSWQRHADIGMAKSEGVGIVGFFDDAARALLEALEGANGVQSVVTYCLTGNVIGQKFVGWAAALRTTLGRVMSNGDLHMLKAQFVPGGGVGALGGQEDGVILHALGAETVDGNTEATSVDNAASSSSGGGGYAVVTALTGFTGVVLKVRHSADNVTFADLVTFTTFTAEGAERVAVTGTVNRYLAASHDVTGSGSATFMVGFARA